MQILESAKRSQAASTRACVVSMFRAFDLIGQYVNVLCYPALDSLFSRVRAENTQGKYSGVGGSSSHLDNETCCRRTGYGVDLDITEQNINEKGTLSIGGHCALAAQRRTSSRVWKG